MHHLVTHDTASKIEIQAIDDRLIDEKMLADRWKISVRTLRNNRVSGNGIRFLKIGSSVRYRMSDVIAFEDASLHVSTSQSNAKN